MCICVYVYMYTCMCVYKYMCIHGMYLGLTRLIVSRLFGAYICTSMVLGRSGLPVEGREQRAIPGFEAGAMGIQPLNILQAAAC